MSLEDFVAAGGALKKGPPCSVCQLPAEILDDLRRGRARRPARSCKTMAAYLASIGHADVSFWMIGHHFREHER